MRRTLVGIILGLALPCSAFAGPAAAKVYRITGVAVSSRDGSPIPYCRLTATAVVEAPEDGGGFGRGGPDRMEVFSELGGGGDFQGPGGQGRGGNFGGRRGGPAEPENTGTADAQGHFSLTVPHAGAWRLTGTARGFRSQSYHQHDRLYYSQIVLTDAVPVYSLTFRMSRDSIIAGVVYDEAGEPVRQARVSAELIPALVPGQMPAAARTVGNASTDDRGHYEMSGLAPGAYRVRVQAQPWYATGARGGAGILRVPPAGATATNQNDMGASLDPSLDMVYATTWFPGADSEEGAQRIELVGGDELQADFHLTAVSSIHLRIPRPEIAAATPGPGGPGRGRPQAMMAQVTKVSADGSIGQVTSIGNNGTGDWDFGGLTPGIYEVRLPGPDGQPGGGEVRQIEVAAGSRVVTLDSARALTKVTVKVTGQASDSFPFVEFVDLDTGRRIVAQENGRGGRGGGRGRQQPDDAAGTDQAPVLQDRTLTASLPPHRYAVSVAGGGGIYLAGMSATDAKVIGHTVEIGGGTPVLTIETGSGRAEMKGRVQDGGKPIEGAMVLLVPITLGQPGDTSVVARAQSNTDGSFGFRAVVPGRYIVVAIEHGWDVPWTNAQTLAGFLGHGMPVELKAGAKVNEELAAVLP